MPNFLTTEDVLLLHSDQIDLYGGEHGVRDLGLLESAVAQPQAAWCFSTSTVSVLTRPRAAFMTSPCPSPLEWQERRRSLSFCARTSCDLQAAIKAQHTPHFASTTSADAAVWSLGGHAGMTFSQAVEETHRRFGKALRSLAE